MRSDNLIKFPEIDNSKKDTSSFEIDFLEFQHVCQNPAIRKIFHEKLKAIKASFSEKISTLPKGKDSITVTITNDLYEIVKFIQSHDEIKESLQGEIIIQAEREKLRQKKVAGF
jgi:hypothetical protein